MRAKQKEQLWDVVIIEIDTGKVESIVGESMHRTKGFYNAEKRADSVLSRINDRFTVRIVSVGKYVCGDVIDCHVDRLAEPDSVEFQRVSPAWQQSLHEQGLRTDRLEHSTGYGRDQGRAQSIGRGIAGGCSIDRLGDSCSSGLPGRASVGSDDESQQSTIERTGGDAWDSASIIECRDGKARRIGRGVQPLAYGIPANLGSREPALRIVAKRARRNRVGRLRGYGNAICPQVAAKFITAFLQTVI